MVEIDTLFDPIDEDENKQFEKIKRYFASKVGQRFLARTIKKYDIARPEFIGIDQGNIDEKPILVIEVKPERFRKIIRKFKPQRVRCLWHLGDDSGDTGVLSIREKEKIEIRADGYISTVGSLGMLDLGEKIRYASRYENYEFQHTSVFILQK